MTRHFYKHKLTGIVAPLNDSFAGVYGDLFERVGDTNAVTEDETEAKPSKTTDAPKEGDK